MKVLAIAVALVGCARVTPPHASAGDAQRANVGLAELQQGRTLLVRKCGSCHQTPLPTAHRASDWPQMLDEMSARASVDQAQRRLILQYLVVMTEAPRDGAKPR
ncbi:MAG: hypothetical protein ABI867_20420 [Kofleriaceae bacterium]